MSTLEDSRRRVAELIERFKTDMQAKADRAMGIKRKPIRTDRVAWEQRQAAKAEAHAQRVAELRRDAYEQPSEPVEGYSAEDWP